MEGGARDREGRFKLCLENMASKHVAHVAMTVPYNLFGLANDRKVSPSVHRDIVLRTPQQEVIVEYGAVELVTYHDGL